MYKVAISVLLPVYNGEKFLSESIESILNQTLKNFELVIIDDASSDKTWEIIKRYRKLDRRIVALRNERNLRISASLNKGLDVAKGKYILRMDADDWSYPRRLEKQYRFMEKHTEIGVSGGSIEVCDEKLKVINKRNYPISDKAVRKVIFRYSPFAHPATIWRKEIMKSAGGYNPNIPLSQDYDLYFRVGKISKFGNLNDVLIKLRTHDDSSSIVRGKFQEQYTIYSRIKAFLEYQYDMSFADKLYTFLQMISMVIIPARVKFWIFNLLRRAK
jgi:glycosyltransferase involved in cell wall biosynthesis